MIYKNAFEWRTFSFFKNAQLNFLGLPAAPKGALQTASKDVAFQKDISFSREISGECVAIQPKLLSWLNASSHAG